MVKKYKSLWDTATPNLRERVLTHGGRGGSGPSFKTIGSSGSGYMKNIKDLSNMNYSGLPKKIKPYAKRGMKDQGLLW